jgi:eukaryotic-like serine/threonine-protein kinase
VPVQGGSAKSTNAAALLRMQGIEFRRDGPRIADWRGDELLFFARLGDSMNVWKVHIASSNWQVSGAPQRLTSSTGLDAYPSLTADGRLLFASLTNSSDVWILPINANAAKEIGRPRPVTETIGPHQFASLSADGKLLAYSSVRYGHPHAMVKDLESGREAPVTNSTASEGVAQLSADGSLLLYLSVDHNASGLVVPVRGGAANQFCTDCDSLYDISADNRVVLYRRGNSIRAFDLLTRADTLFMRSDKDQLFQEKFSPDGRWVTFEAVRRDRSRLYVAALRNSATPAPESEWIPVTGNEGWADKPRWSPDGNVIYFISNRDGFFCMWAQRLSRGSKVPTGPPVSISHFHSSRLSMGNVGAGGVMEISVARDKIAFNLGELTGNIWERSLSH